MSSKKESKNARAFFTDCELKRLEQLEEEFESSEECQSISKQRSALFEELRCAIPEELHRLLIQYGSTANDLMLFQEKFFYRQGLMDCFMYTQMLMGDRKDIKMNISIL